MSKQPTLKQVQDLTAKADEAVQKAAKTIQPAHQEALEAAKRLRDDLATNTSEQSRRQRLARIVDEAVGKAPLNTDVAATVLAQFQDFLLQVTGQNRLTGVGIWGMAQRYSWDWKPEQRIKVLQSLVMASRGEVDTGLAEFPADWSSAVSLDDLEAFAELVAPEAAAEYREQQAQLAGEFAQAQTYLDALEQAAPALFVTAVDGGQGVAVRNKRGGDVTVAGQKFAGGAVTELTPEEFGQVRDTDQFQALLENGTLEITTTGILAEPA